MSIEKEPKDNVNETTPKIENGNNKVKIKTEKKPSEESNMEYLEKDSKVEVVDLESVLRELKIFGRYHLKFMFLVGMLAFGSMWHSTNYVFAIENVGYRCKYANCDHTDLSELQFNSSFDYKCHKYNLYDSNGTCTEENFDTSNATDCDEWEYDRPDSFVAEFDLGCEDWKKTLIGTMHSAGYMIGLFLVGPLSDKFGRKLVVIFTAVSCAVIGIIKSMVYSYWLYVALETIEPLLGDCYSSTFTLAIESVTKEHRPLMIFVLSMFTTLGGMVLAVIAWLSPTWRIYLIAIYAPAFVYILYIFWMDESVRWLLNKGKKDKVDNMLRRAAKMNNIVIDEAKLSNLKCEENSSNTSLKTLLKVTFSSKKLFLRLLCCICMWFTALFNAYSLLVNSVLLEGNKYLNYGLTVSAGIPASLAILYLLTKCSRKKPLIFSFLLTGTFCTAHSVLPTDYTCLSTMLYITGKFFSTVAMRIVYIYTSELFPTYTRNTMHALCSALARIAAIVAPQTPLLRQYWPGFPSLIMGILSLLTTFVVTLLPDTSDEVLPDNVGQAEAVGKKEKKIDVNPKSKESKENDLCSRL